MGKKNLQIISNLEKQLRMLRVCFVSEIYFCSCLLYNTTSYDTFLFWVSLHNSYSQSKMIELKFFDATICPHLICSSFSQVKQRHPKPCPLRIYQGACVQNNIRYTLGDFLFAFFSEIAGCLSGMFPKSRPSIHGDILLVQSPTVSYLHASSQCPSH